MSIVTISMNNLGHLHIWANKVGVDNSNSLHHVSNTGSESDMYIGCSLELESFFTYAIKLSKNDQRILRDFDTVWWVYDDDIWRLCQEPREYSTLLLDIAKTTLFVWDGIVYDQAVQPDRLQNFDSDTELLVDLFYSPLEKECLKMGERIMIVKHETPEYQL